MKIKTKELSYEEVLHLKRAEHKLPKKPGFILRSVIRAAAIPDLFQTKFEYSEKDMEKAGKGPCLLLMNHSAFIDLEIVSKIMYPKPYCIVCTSDGFVGKEALMRNIGCIPTQKFVNDVTLINDIKYALEKLKVSVLMYPEASYSFDGTPTALPDGLGRLIKILNVPVVCIHTEGAFARDPLYNCLQKRKVRVKATVTCIASKEEITESDEAELFDRLKRQFEFDNFEWQQKNKVEITEPFRADGLNRILYKCAQCGREGQTEGKGEDFVCHACGAEFHLNRFGRLEGKNCTPNFTHIPLWFRWERECVKREIEDGTYCIDTPVKIGVLTDYKAIYKIGKGRLVHNINGFVLYDKEGNEIYRQKPLCSYGLYSDYYWYELGDVISIGNKDLLYYCFPEKKDIVAKARFAAEELYKITRAKKRNG